ncbi:MAG: hypothetical protein KF710_02810 [Rhodocyclaceae bacterium]|nr:hypothetical protein [Rhodocyclaceae bacterium]
MLARGGATGFVLPDKRALVATSLACLALLVAFLALADGLTRGYRLWTFESLRRDDAAAGRIKAPSILLAGPQGTTPTPWPGPPGEIYRGFRLYPLPDRLRCTRCRIHAPQALLDKRFGAHSPVRLVSIAFDRPHDTPAALAHYASVHRQNPALWLLGIPQSAAAQEDLLRALGIVAIPDGLGGFTHNGAIHLIDAQGTVRAIHDLDQWPRALDQALAMSKGGHP